jgi:hypothetical protein
LVKFELEASDVDEGPVGRRGALVDEADAAVYELDASRAKHQIGR